jgi:RND family efflux transporter MFP subunit
VRKFILFAVVVAAAVALALPLQGRLRLPQKSAEPHSQAPAALHVTVSKVAPAEFVETVLVTGSLVAREEILIGPEVEGLRVLEVLVDEGDQVKAGDVLARLVKATVDAQLAQNEANLARSNAAIAQARSAITQAEAKLEETRNAFERGKPLRQSGYLAESVMDQREAAAKTAQAQLVAARDGLRVAEAERAQIEAQRRELAWRRSKTEVTAPTGGLVSRRNAKVGASASMTLGDPMFRIVAGGEIELDAEVTEARLADIREGQPARIEVAGVGEVMGKVRLVPVEVDRATRLGRVRIFIGANPALRVGAFARGRIETARGRGLAIPASAVLYGDNGPTVQLVTDGAVVTRPIKLGLSSGDIVEVREGLVEGDLVVAKSGTFLRDGDAISPVLAKPEKVSEVRK